MNDFIKDTTEIPSLSFGTPEPEPELPVQQPEEKKEVMDDSVLSDEQKAMVDAFVSQIDLANTNGILQYGAGSQKKMADFSEKALENVKTKDLGEVGTLLRENAGERQKQRSRGNRRSAHLCCDRAENV